MLGQVALIYDATTPAGAGAARELARLGAWVGCALRENHETGQALVDEIRMAGGRALLLAGDPAQPREAWTLLQRLEAEWGEIRLVALCVPPVAASPARAMLATLIEAGVGTLASDARFLLALPPDAAPAEQLAGKLGTRRLVGVSGAIDEPATGVALAALALDAT